MLLALAGAVGFGLYVRMTPQAAKVPPELRREEKTAPKEAVKDKEPSDEPKATPSEEKVVMVAALNGESLRMKRLAKPVPAGEDARLFATNETLREIGLSRVQASRIEIKEGLATVDFNAEIAQGMGSAEEGQMLRALRMALGQFPEVERIGFTVDGEPVEELSHFEVADPLEVIRPPSVAP